MDNYKILIADDEDEIRDLLAIYLKCEGFEVTTAADGIEALQMLQKIDFDLIILDIMMPRLDGIQTCIKIRKDNGIPIIMLSAKSEDVDKILGLNTGADDYVTKPFNPLEIVARVKSQLRRYTRLNDFTPKLKDEFEIGGLVINTASHQVKVDGKDIKLTPTEFSILEVLARNKGRVLSIESIYESVWNEPFYESENTVAVHIRNIREKIEINPKEPKYIKVVWGVGYKIDNES
ncbi:response regulator with CheY-like receiver domain and winged-helix DNA-binding domain [Desulfitobacterium dehalogenans ATCC 51507]|uniref:Stage 0 sporulation protein A homolog n=1 Tax=Desulfitobacterium dehalogenans (strain ATCC 51507 / DSM 9161 / JW/IU-DC1) TaxID=756499 RepID=I4A7M7_DESDJ|nr:response regulator transcription factor [Desulfitobacterium dehalogenans]AFL99961.1 response regulator with CheY-like receiver domain and winged-helix DNA-binding domain [Desulfitobacterium dehalogenans ATCC 51507]